MSQQRHLLIDGDIIAYQQCLSLEEPIHWGNDLWTLHCDAKQVKFAVDDVLNTLMETLEADQCIIALSDYENFRKDINPEYKRSRQKTRKPVCLGEVREYLMYERFAKVYSKLEADDILGVMATAKETKKIAPERIIVSIDKDFKTVPCKLYNPNKHDEGINDISEGLADYWFMYQTLIGDSTDGYGGCPGIGPKAAEKLMGSPREASLEELWPLVLKAYEKKGFGEPYVLVQARMARILRAEDYDRKRKKIKLWTPRFTPMLSQTN